MSDLVIFYSLSGKSRQVAEWLASGLHAHLSEILEENPRDFAFRGLFRSGLDSLLRRRPRIRPMDLREEIYDRIILACPVWGGRIAGPARTWLHDHGQRARSLGLALQSGQGIAHDGVLQEFETIIGRRPNPLLTVGESDFRDGSAEHKVGDFVRSITPEAARFPTN